MKKNDAIVFVCVNFNSTDYTIKYVDSILNFDNFKGVDIKIIVVDNSDTQSLDLISYVKKIDCVTLLTCENNGYFAALNTGLNSINMKDYDFVCIGNNDLTFTSSFVNDLYSLDIPNRVFAISPDIINKDGYHQNPHHERKLSFLKILSFDFYFSSYHVAVLLLKLKLLFSKKSVNIKNNNAFYINQGVGAFYILTKSFIDKFNYLYFPSFLYCEEAALSWQIHSFDGSILYEPSIEVFHHESASLSNFPKKTNYSHARKSYWKIRKLLF